MANEQVKKAPAKADDPAKKAVNKANLEKANAARKAKLASKKKEEVQPPFETREDLKKLLLYTIIVPNGQGDAVIRILKRKGSSAQFVRLGEGTASKQVLSVLHIEDTKKEIVYSLVREDLVPEIKVELEAFFLSSKRNRGIAFTIELNSIVGVKMYKFLSQTVRG